MWKLLKLTWHVSPNLQKITFQLCFIKFCKSQHSLSIQGSLLPIGLILHSKRQLNFTPMFCLPSGSFPPELINTIQQLPGRHTARKNKCFLQGAKKAFYSHVSTAEQAWPAIAFLNNSSFRWELWKCSSSEMIHQISLFKSEKKIGWFASKNWTHWKQSQRPDS